MKNGSNSFFDMHIPTPVKPGGSRLTASTSHAHGNDIPHSYPVQDKKPIVGHPYYKNSLLPPSSYSHKQQNSYTGCAGNKSTRNQLPRPETDNMAPPRPARNSYPLPFAEKRNSTGSNGSSTSGSYVVDNKTVFLEGLVPDGRGYKSIVV